jgi:hypothetical protein
MPAEPTRKSLEPQLLVKDKVVQVGSLSWADFKNLVDAFSSANLPLPTLDSEALRGQFAALQATALVDGSVTVSDIVGLLVEFVSTNLPTITTWVARHPLLIDSLIAGSTNLTPEEAATLTAGEVLRLARAAFRALIDDGVFAEAAGFFGELVGLKPATKPPPRAGASHEQAIATPTSAGD